MSYTVALISAHPTSRARQFGLQLTWTDSTDPNAASVNVYRATVSGGPYTQIQNGIPMGVQLYNDFNIIPTTTYFYVTTEVNNVGAESGFSVEQNGVAVIL